MEDWKKEAEIRIKNFINSKLAGEKTFDEILNDKENAIYFLQELEPIYSSYFFKMLSKKLKENKDVVKVAVQRYGYSLEYASPEFRDNKEVVLEAVKNKGDILYLLSDRLCDDEEVVLEAINEGISILYASPRLRNNKKFIILSVQSFTNFSSDIISFLTSDKIKEDLKKDIDVLRALAPNFKFILNEDYLKINDKNILYDLAKINGYVLCYIDKSLIDKKILKLAFMQNGITVRCLSKEEKEKFLDKELGLIAVNSNWKSLRYFNDKLKDDFNIVMEAVKKSGEALKFASLRLQNDLTLIDEAYKSYPNILNTCKMAKNKLLFTGLEDRGIGYLGILELLFNEIESYGEEVEKRCCFDDNTSWFETKKIYIEYYTQNKLETIYLWDSISELSNKLSEALRYIL